MFCYALLSVSQQTQRNFEEAMKDGELSIRCGNCFMMGCNGSGKTCSLHAFLEEDAPIVRESTSLMKCPVRTLAQSRIGVSTDKTTSKPSFVRITDNQFCDMLSMSASMLRSLPRQRKGEVSFAESSTTYSPPEKLRQTEPSVIASSAGLQFQPSGFQREFLVRMNAGSKVASRLATDELNEKSLVDMKDSGGQPMFHEILPVFVTHTMFGLLTVKLNERLDSYPMVEYYIDGKRIGESFKSPFTHLQTFHHCMKVLQSTCEHGRCPKIAFIGTHNDRRHECPDEDLAAKSERLLDIIPPDMKKHVIAYRPGKKSLIFPINALNPGKEGQAVLAELRDRIYKELLTVPKVRIPHRYFALGSTFQRLVKDKNKAILSKEECFKEAENFHFTRESFEDALKYLHSTNLIIYYSEILPGVVFTDAQFLLDKITELVKHNLMLHSEQCQEAGSLGDFEKFKSCGIITRNILSNFRSGYVPNLFSEDDLITVFKHLLIISEVVAGEFLMPCLLREEAIPTLASLIIPSLLFYFEEGPKLGVYCFLLSSLITDAKWKLLMENDSPVQLSRNRARFMIPGSHPGFVTITDSFSTFFEVDVTFPADVSSAKALEICKDVCPTIRETILTGIRKASRKLNYTNSFPSVAFLCLNHQAPALHPATISSHGLLTCTKHPASVFSKMTEKHQIWLGKESPTPCVGTGELYCPD